ncbi:MAG: ATP-binding protein [Desulfobacterales bacterium]|nr:ATP-binding protein [Desulfobacterales bacterium]
MKLTIGSFMAVNIRGELFKRRQHLKEIFFFMTIIKSLTIDGLAEAGAASFILDDRVCAFYGLNGAGKKSIIKILYSALRGDASILKHIPFKTASVEIFSEEENRIFRHSIARPPAHEPDAPAHPHSFPPAWRVEPEEGAMGRPLYRQVYLPTSRVYLIPQPKKPDPLSLLEPSEETRAELLETYGADSLTALWKEYDIDLQLKSGAVLTDAGLKILNTVFSKKERRNNPEFDMEPEAAYEHVKLFLNEYGLGDDLISLETFRRDVRENTRLKRIALYARDAMDALTALNAPRGKLKKLIERILGEGRRVSFTPSSIEITSGDKEHIPLNALSLGEINAMLLLVAAMSVGKGVLLIDYPEFSIHVDFQRTLIKIMRLLNPFAQIIVATHSPAIMESLEERMLFETPGNQRII